MVMKINVLTKYLLYAGLAVMAASCKDGNGAATASGTFEAEEITVSAEASGMHS